MSTFLSQSLELSSGFFESKGEFLFAPKASEMKAGAEDHIRYSEVFPFYVVFVSTMGTLWNGSRWQWLLRKNEKDGNILHDQDPKGREALS